MFGFSPPPFPLLEERDEERNTHEVEHGMISAVSTEPQHKEFFLHSICDVTLFTYTETQIILPTLYSGELQCL